MTLPTFSSLLGNQEAKDYLQTIIQKKTVPNVLLFSGPDGVGKSLFAECFAHKLMYSSIPSHAIRKFETKNHPDLHVLYPEGKSQTHPISQIRSLLEEAYKPPFEAEQKVFIIHEAERMLPSSSNALLKTLEEPTLDSYFLLLSSKPQELLPTVASRCQRVIFHPVLEKEILELFKDHPDRNKIAKLSQGSIGLAHKIIEDPHYEEKKELLLSILVEKPNYSSLISSLEKLEALCQKGDMYKEIDLILAEILFWYRDLHLLRKGLPEEELFFPQAKQKHYTKELPRFDRVCSLLEEVKEGVQRNNKFSVCLENFFLSV